jgi:multiple sugar transport system ATP-binding protein
VPHVILDRVTKVFDRPRASAFAPRTSLKAVSEVSLEAHSGECLALVGPSGSGKTTILRLIAGLESPTGGTIRLDGTIVNDLPPKKRDVAMVFQNPSLYPHLSAYDNLALGLKLRKCSPVEVRQRAIKAAQMLKIHDQLSSSPIELSGGQRQRVAIGRAIVRQAGVLLLDEPLANVEPGLRARFRADLARLRSEYRTTMIYVTHDHMDAMMVGSRVAVLHQGVLQQVADPATLYHTPANLFVAGFIGSPPMNLFRGTLWQRGPGLFFEPNNARQDSCEAIKPQTFAFSLPASLGPKLSELLGKPIILGLRPEHMEMGPATDTVRDCWTFKARIVAIENAGADTFLHAFCLAGSFIARVPSPTRLQLNEERVFSVDPTRARFFDEATGNLVL